MHYPELLMLIYMSSSISLIQPTWLQDLQQAYQHDPKSKQLLQQLAVHSPSGQFHLASSLLHPSCTCISVPAFTLLIQKNRWGGFPPLSPQKKKASFRACLESKKFCAVPVTSNLATHEWSIKCK